MNGQKRYRILAQYYGMWHMSQVLTEAELSLQGFDRERIDGEIRAKKMEVVVEVPEEAIP